MKVSAKRTNGPEIEVDYEFGETLADMVKRFGEGIVFAHAKGSLVVSLQGWLRAQLDSDKKPGEIKDAVKNWKPGQRKQGKSQAEKLKEQLAAMTPEERAALLKDLKAQTTPKAA